MPKLFPRVAGLLAVVLFAGLPETSHAQSPAAASPSAVPPAPSGPPAFFDAIRTPDGLTADHAAELAMRDLPEVARAELGLDEAEANAAAARAAWLPRLSFDASFNRLSRVDNPPLSFGGMTFAFPQVLSQYALRATAIIPVTEYFLGVWPLYNAAQRGEAAARHQLEAERRRAVVQAREGFYQYVRASAHAAVARQSVETLRRVRDDLDARVRAGVRARADLLDAESQLAAAEGALVRAEGIVEVTAASLRRAMGAPADMPLPIGEPLGDEGTLPTRTLASWIASAQASRPETLALTRLIEAREARARAARVGAYPQISLQGFLDYANPNNRIVPQTDDFRASWQAGVVATWSPTEVIRALQSARTADVLANQARLDLETLRQGIAVEVTQAHADLRAAQASIASAERAMVAADTAFQDRTQMLTAGVATTTELLLAEEHVRNAQLGWINARIDAQIAAARFNHSVGDATIAADDGGAR